MVSRNLHPLVSQDEFLVCGLGSLGQHCVANLKTFGVVVRGIDRVRPAYWEVPNLPQLLDKAFKGDCRRAEVLEAAGVKNCRAILLVTTDERVNLEAALTARLLNPKIRLVIRSDKQNLNDLLAQQLTNFVGFEPSQLAAPAFALAAFGEDLLGFFKLGDRRFRVVKQVISPHHRWCNKRSLHEIENRDRRILRHLQQDIVDLDTEAQINQRANPYSPSTQFYTWLPNALIGEGDVVVTVEAEPEGHISESKVMRSSRQRPSLRHRIPIAMRQWRELRQSIITFWRDSYRNQIRRVALLCGLTVITLCLMGTLLLVATGVAPNLADGFYATVVLLLGGYGDLFSDFGLKITIPWWLRLFSLTLTLVGTAFIGVLYALLTEKLLTLKFAFLERRPPVPETGHVVVIWLGRVGRQVVQLLQDLQQPVVGITSQTVEADTLPQLPLVTGRVGEVLASTNIATAKSVVAVSDDEMQNLELGLLAHRVNPHCRLIIRTYDQSFTDKVAQIFPYAQVLCASALSAEAFAGAAFGENVVSLFRLYHQTVLVTQYDIEAGDTLNGLLLADIAYGYGVVPILHQRDAQAPRIMPSDDIDLRVGDRLVVLATIRGLRRIEQGDLAPKSWQVALDQLFSAAAELDAASQLSRVSGCNINQAHTVLKQLPTVFPQRLYRHQALRLVRLLGKAQLKARLLPLADKMTRR